MKKGVIESTFIRSSLRFDGKFHLSEGLEVRHIINHSPFGNSLIRDVTSDIYCPGIFRRNYTKTGTPFLGGGDIQKADYDSGKYLRAKTTPKHDILQIKKGWTLVTCGGTIGDSVFANNLLAKCWVSQHVMRVIPSSIKEGMLFAYLASKYGHSLLTTNTYGSVIPTLNASNIASLPIPNFPEDFQQRIDGLIQESARLREKASEKVQEAKRALASYIGIDFIKHNFVTQKVTSKEILSSLKLRLDPPAHINDGVQTMKIITSKFICEPIGTINCKVYRPGIFKRVYVENGLPYIKGAEVFLTNPFKRCVHVSRTKTPFIEEMTLKEGQILIMCAGTVSVGLSKMITKEYEDKKCIGSQDIIRLESNDDLYTKEYLYTYLQQPYVIDYIISMKYGSVIERIEPFHIESIPIIKPTKELSDRITVLIKENMDCSYKAFLFEEKAIALVEEEIERWNN